MKKIFCVACLSLLLCLQYSCQREILTPQSRQTHVSQIARRSDICFTSLDRSVFGISFSPPSEDDLRVIAGFETSFAHGADPFPCNRLNLAVAYGRFSFDLSTINLKRLDQAYIVAENFTAIGDNRIRIAVPWGFSGGWISDGTEILDFCQFKVKFVTDIPATSIAFRSPPPPARELRFGEQIFSIANGGSGNRRINVTSEIRSQIEGGNNRPFFLVEPTGVALDYQASNRFVGFFTFSLVVELYS